MKPFNVYFENLEICQLLRENKNNQAIDLFINSIYSQVDDSFKEELNDITEAWYNPMDWIRGAGRMASSSFLGKPKKEHIAELLRSLENVISKAGLMDTFKEPLNSMKSILNDVQVKEPEQKQEIPQEPGTSTTNPNKTSFKMPLGQRRRGIHPMTAAMRSSTATEKPENDFVSGSEEEKEFLKNARIQDIVKYRQQKYGTGFVSHYAPEGDTIIERSFSHWKMLKEDALPDTIIHVSPNYYDLARFAENKKFYPIRQSGSVVWFDSAGAPNAQKSYDFANSVNQTNKYFARLDGFSVKVVPA